MPQSLSFGPFTIYYYGIFVGLGLIFVYLNASKNCQKFNLTVKNIDLSFMITALLGLIFARLYHIVSSLKYYSIHVKEIFYIWNGGLGIFGLIFGTIFGLWLSAKKQKISFENLLNLFFPPILLAQALGRIGNYFNQEGFGPNYFSTFFLEFFLCLVAFLLFFVIRKEKKFDYGFAYYLVSYGLIRSFTEFFRIDTWTVNGINKFVSGEIKLAWLFSGIMLATGLFLLFKKKVYP